MRHYTVRIHPPFTCVNGAVVTEHNISGNLTPERAAEATDQVWSPESRAALVIETDGMFEDAAVVALFTPNGRPIVEHFIIGEGLDRVSLITACGTTVPGLPIPPEDAPRCATCTDLLVNGAVS